MLKDVIKARGSEFTEVKRHSDVHSVVRLTEIRRAGVVVDGYLYLVDAWERVHYYHVLVCVLHFPEEYLPHSFINRGDIGDTAPDIAGVFGLVLSHR